MATSPTAGRYFFTIGPGNSFYAREVFVPEAVSSNTGKNLLSEDCLQRKNSQPKPDRTTNLSMQSNSATQLTSIYPQL